LTHFHKPSRVIRIVLLAVILSGIILSASPPRTVRAHHLHYIITNFYPTAEFPWVTWNLCSHPGGLYPHLPLPRYGYYEINYNVSAGNVVVTSFSTTGGFSFSSLKEYPSDYSGVVADMLPAPAFSFPANTVFTVIVKLYQNRTDLKGGTPLMRQKFLLNCTTRVMSSNVITYH
jgi:hypothetical protein